MVTCEQAAALPPLYLLSPTDTSGSYSLLVRFTKHVIGLEDGAQPQLCPLILIHLFNMAFVV